VAAVAMGAGVVEHHRQATATTATNPVMANREKRNLCMVASVVD